MADSSELESIKQLLGRVVMHLETLTTQIAELRPLKQIAPQYKAEERKIGELMATDVRSLRQLADTILGKKGES